MVTVEVQKKLRNKYRWSNSQLILIARRLVDELRANIAAENGLRGKGEAMSFAVCTGRTLKLQAEFNHEAAQPCDIFRTSYRRDRGAYIP